MPRITRTVTLTFWQCTRCGHEWLPRQKAPPKVCPNPKCKSPYWDRPRQKRRAKRAAR